MNRALVLFEARRLLRHPVPWAAAALALAVVAVRNAAWLPDLTMTAIDTVAGSSLVAAAMLVVAHLAASRDRRHGLPERLAAMPAREVARTRAVVLAAPAVGGLVATVMIFPYLLVVSASDTAAGRLDPYEAFGGVALAMLAASAGAALGRWTPWPVAPPVAIFLVAFALLGDPRGEYGGWFLPVVPAHDVSWGDRPTGWHLVYLLAAAVFCAAVALLRHGPRPARTVVALAALLVAVPAGASATASAPAPGTASRAAPGPAGPAGPADQGGQGGQGGQVCERHDGVSYCAYPAYRPWIGAWARAVRPIVSAVPRRALERIPVIRQGPAHSSALDGPNTPRTWTVWSTDPGQHGTVLAGRVAAAVTGLDATGPEGRCGGLGRARTVVALWLAGRAGPLLEAPGPDDWRGVPSGGPAPAWQLRVRMGDDGRELWFPGQLGVRYGAAEVGYARRLLGRPDADRRVRAGWDVLTAPGTTIEQALPLLGLRPEFPSGKDVPCP
ncbi:hypothetical protein [Streptosporangium sp. NPDC023615]|uniref:hypothetical protein n=1 Tax=Streptosporangium sp. NPDC023615 TaxID=3154794 RepID=UPI0034130EA3